jgi:CelD/BcsL family acetyltransferase involved in cellulose biosynthesis
MEKKKKKKKKRKRKRDRKEKLEHVGQLKCLFPLSFLMFHFPAFFQFSKQKH